jgi:hypothetical protein
MTYKEQSYISHLSMYNNTQGITIWIKQIWSFINLSCITSNSFSSCINSDAL